MTRSASGSALGTQFDGFLFASVRDDPNGPLSVLSALARLDVDPWQTAASLAQLPKMAAAQRLASLFAGLPGEQAAPDTFARLVTFLPAQVDARGAEPKTGGRATPQTVMLLVVYIIWMLTVMSAQGFGGRHQLASPAARVGQAGAAAKAP